MSEKERLEKELSSAERDLSRSKRFAEKHAERSNRKQKQLAEEYVDRDSERVYRLRRKLGKEN